MMKDRVLSMIGLAARGKNVISGEFMTEKAIKTGEACLVIIAEDASDNTKKKFSDSCTFYEVPYYVYGDSDDLGHSMGKEFRKTLAVLDEGLANSIIKRLEEAQHSENLEG